MFSICDYWSHPTNCIQKIYTIGLSRSWFFSEINKKMLNFFIWVLTASCGPTLPRQLDAARAQEELHVALGAQGHGGAEGQVAHLQRAVHAVVAVDVQPLLGGHRDQVPGPA
eukprot:CAMPEP_0194700558 /NCGR_PEP_ID=MMETSP0295-20121207/25632_1 /TAXON_ID=39354 /ORGANISM="Heterosigma akashiwo, Strain CCMP2393" /LENGTH=111 /DNA_ID=CAMNT_0039594521 /DNA_START=82 /DNA_END=414 /DNA_ORIENTATION=-